MRKHEITAKVTDLKRLKYSLNGNARFEIYTDNGMTRTRKDCMLNSAISNYMIGKIYKFNITEYDNGKTYLDNFEKVVKNEK